MKKKYHDVNELREINGFLKSKKLVQALLVSIVFFVIQFILVHYHELWADEIHAWEIVRCSHSFSELLFNTRYEGHPQMWFLMLFFLQKFTLSYFSMQVLHIVIAACAVFVFCFYSPFTFLQNILFCAGYFISYEYSIISRNYSIELVLLFLCAGIYTKYKGKYLGLLSILFFLLFQTNVFAIIIGLPFYIYMLWSIWETDKTRAKQFIVPSIIVFMAIIVAAVTTLPPADSAFAAWSIKPDARHFMYVLSVVFTSYFPLPEFNLHFWNTNIIDHAPHHVFIEAILSVVVLSLAIILFRNNKKVLILFCLGTLGECLFIYIKYYGYIRHHGHVFLLFILCYWLYCSDSKVIWGELSRTINGWFMGAILAVQLAASCCANMYDVKYPFSNDIPAANYIHSEGLDNLPMLGDGDFATAGISGILDYEIYYMRPEKLGKYILPDQNWGPFISFGEKDLLSEVNKALREKRSDVIVVLSYPYMNYELMGWTLLQTFEGSIIGEDYYIYKVRYAIESPESLNGDAEMLVAKNKFEEAVRLFEKAIHMKPDYAEAYMNMADCYNNGLHDYDKALANIDSAVKYSPQNYNVVFDKGAILYNMGRKSEGLTFFKEALKLDPHNINTYLTLGQCYDTLRNYDSAITYLKAALKISPHNKDIENSLAHCSKAKGNK
ncbi:MAG TPA: tetratricopeptide repeat protein [Bacteroidia bacterium]|nr:tetratricopeptide repeat protein [Bacteroidia bacterium]